MKQHKWHKEIKAWADGGEIEMWYGDRWEQVHHAPDWFEHEEYRIKTQPKEPQYIYVWKCEGQVLFSEFDNVNEKLKTHYKYIGKIKLEDTE